MTELRVPPNHPESEKAILGGLLLDNDKLPIVMESLTVDDFYVGAHRHIFAAMQGLYQRDEAIDYVTLPTELQFRRTLDKVGGIPFITELADAVPSAANIKFYVNTVKEKSLWRQAIKSARSLEEAAYSSDSKFSEVIDAIQAELLALTRNNGKVRREKLVPIEQAVSEWIKHMEAVQFGQIEVPQIWTGIGAIDRATGGLQPGDLVVICGRPSHGKTALALNLARHIGKEHATAIFELEMSRGSCIGRLMAAEARVNTLNIRRFQCSDQDFSRFIEAGSRFSEMSMWISEASRLAPRNVREQCREIEITTGKRVLLLIVDYLQLMRADEKHRSREEYVASITRDCKLLAKELGMIVVLLCQLNRKVEERPKKIPQLSDLRESGAIEQDADVILGVYWHWIYSQEEKDYPTLKIPILKAREGTIGYADVSWNPAYQLIQEQMI